ncbi:carbohydrate-binding module family 21 protein [Sporormia fimetaria CBS 119925]|uniref:Carbohydrate-binding module family 21 protein n=1 Tax=Sporormia fimetaria CBS 119925 TaxID=1340428 RepID=A0A6A6VNQ5_9PLEO|nr:carbohydrate-binding module family 21 protein [Sporormia fimetaria CBS 119925]
MPYTPPTQRSPATSKPNSPVLSRSHSYTDQRSLPYVQPQKPSLPRSVSSTSYLSKQRRSPVISRHEYTSNEQSVNGSATSGADGSRGHDTTANGSARRFPYVSKRLIPPGAPTTPPDSSDDEERGRNIGNMRELQEALSNIEVKRTQSPPREHTSKAVVVALPAAVQSLSAEARKIAHSRSASELTLSAHAQHLSGNAIQTSSSENSDDEDEGLRMKPPLLRKKSGELVKPALRPASRRRPSSMPGTPTYSKAVHFNEDMEQVRHFLSLDRPMAVSAGSSPVETYDSEADYPWGYDDGYRSTAVEWEIKVTNFPADTFERKTAPVRVERIFLASDHKTLVGTVAVANLAFQKTVVARFTLDYWNTTSEVLAEYNHDIRKKQASDGCDRFNFNIKLADQANLENKTLFLCVRYSVNGQDFWDNNNSMNYQVDFIKKKKQPGSGAKPSHGASPIPRSRNSPISTRPRAAPIASFDDDFGRGLDEKFEFGSGTIRLRPRPKRANFTDPGRRNASSQAFSSRYDFSASLSAALTTAQTALGDRSGIKPAPSTASVSVSTAPIPGASSDASTVGVQSAEYNELIQKFCFFGAPTGNAAPVVTAPPKNESVADSASDASSPAGSNQSSATNSPSSPSMPTFSSASNSTGSKSPSQFLSRSSSPGPVTGSGPDDHPSSGLQYGYSMHGGIFPDRSHTPQVRV